MWASFVTFSSASHHCFNFGQDLIDNRWRLVRLSGRVMILLQSKIVNAWRLVRLSGRIIMAWQLLIIAAVMSNYHSFAELMIVILWVVSCYRTIPLASSSTVLSDAEEMWALLPIPSVLPGMTVSVIWGSGGPGWSLVSSSNHCKIRFLNHLRQVHGEANSTVT